MIKIIQTKKMILAVLTAIIFVFVTPLLQSCSNKDELTLTKKNKSTLTKKIHPYLISLESKYKVKISEGDQRILSQSDINEIEQEIIKL